MIRDLDIYRSANVLIREHGEDAPIEAANCLLRSSSPLAQLKRPKLGEMVTAHAKSH